MSDENRIRDGKFYVYNDDMSVCIKCRNKYHNEANCTIDGVLIDKEDIINWDNLAPYYKQEDSQIKCDICEKRII